MSHPTQATASHGTDPVVDKLKRQINRSAGQHKRAISEGTLSAQTILRRVPMKTDPLKLDDGIPVLRMVHSRHERPVVEPVPFNRPAIKSASEPRQASARDWRESQAQRQAEAEAAAGEPSGTGIALAIVIGIVAVVGVWSVVVSTGAADGALRVLSAAIR